MTDSLKNTQSDKEGTYALVYVEGTPKWDFNADYVAYVLGMADNHLLIPVLRQHTSFQDRKGFWKENASALKRSVSGIKFKGDNMELGEPNEGPFRDFVDEHFEFLFGTSSDDPEVHRKFLNEHSYLKTRIFREGVQGILHEEPDEEFTEDASVPIFDIMAGEIDRDIEVYQPLFSTSKMRPETVSMVHSLREIKEQDYQKYRKATTRHLNARKRKLLNIEDHYLLSTIYDGLVRSIDGALVDGKPCTEETKQDWLGLVPLEHKLLVLTVAMREVEGKNVS